MQFNTFRSGGIVHTITDIEHVGKALWPKREIWIEIPTQPSTHDQKSEVIPYELFGDECAMADRFSPGDWVDFIFRLTSRLWSPKDDPSKKKCFLTLKLIDMKIGPNPFEEKKDIKNTPEDLSNSIVSDLADKVKDYANEESVKDVNDPFAEQPDDLPF